MGDTKIEWTEKVWNPVTGCTKVSQGCKNCYAERVFPRPYPGRAFTDVRCHEDRLTQRFGKKPVRVFVNSMSDLFHDAVPELFIDKVMAIIASEPRHTFQVLTKRPERMLKYFSKFRDANHAGDELGTKSDENGNIPDGWEFDESFECYVSNSITGALGEHGVGWPMKNLWLGVSVEDQKSADDRIPLLLQTPAAVRWISAEPLLGPIDLAGLPSRYADDEHPFLVNRPLLRLDALRGGHRCGAAVFGPATGNLDWVVVGGESGPNARPMHPDWARSLRDQCQSANVPFFFKQWGEWAPTNHHEPGRTEYCFDGPSTQTPNCSFNGLSVANVARVGKKAAGSLLDGREHKEYPNA